MGLSLSVFLAEIVNDLAQHLMNAFAIFALQGSAGLQSDVSLECTSNLCIGA